MNVTLVLIGCLTITAYQPIVTQTDSTPCIAANGQRVHTDGVAVSRDLHVRWGGPLAFGDVIYIEGTGWKIVNDVMNKRHTKSIDILVRDLKSEEEFYKKCKFCKIKVYRLKGYKGH